jgi:hypothetical protein
MLYGAVVVLGTANIVTFAEDVGRFLASDDYREAF